MKKNKNNPSNNNSENWYVRMHQQTDDINVTIKPKHRLNLSIFFRIWFTVGLIVIFASIIVFNQLFKHVEPTSKQVIEDTLVDTAMLLATSLSQPLQSGLLQDAAYQEILDTAFNENLPKPVDNSRKFVNKQKLNEWSTWFYQKRSSSFRIYVTNQQGMVIYDSLPKNHMSELDGLAKNENAEGKDYSQWNDVYLTLKGQYGARSSRSNRDDSSTTIMYVAQPIKNNKGQLIGVVSVGKPVATILPYIDVARQRMLTTSLIITFISVLLAGLVAWWLQQSLALVTRYTQSLASNTNKPSFYLGRELNELTDTIEDMKHRLENKAYVTDYVHTLTHELKSPLTAIKASGELLADGELDPEDRETLSQTINQQSQKLQALIDRLLLLAKVEQPNFQLNKKPINIMEMMSSLINNHAPQIQQKSINTSFFKDGEICTLEDMILFSKRHMVLGDSFWLSQALDNLLSNAIHFSEKKICICIAEHDTDMALSKHSTTSKQLELIITNDGLPIPDYALDKIFNRYFSLSHQASSTDSINSTNKGTGLGLTLAKQVIEHHEGKIEVQNMENIAISSVIKVTNNQLVNNELGTVAVRVLLGSV